LFLSTFEIEESDGIVPLSEEWQAMSKDGRFDFVGLPKYDSAGIRFLPGEKLDYELRAMAELFPIEATRTALFLRKFRYIRLSQSGDLILHKNIQNFCRWFFPSIDRNTRALIGLGESFEYTSPTPFQAHRAAQSEAARQGLAELRRRSRLKVLSNDAAEYLARRAPQATPLRHDATVRHHARLEDLLNIYRIPTLPTSSTDSPPEKLINNCQDISRALSRDIITNPGSMFEVHPRDLEIYISSLFKGKGRNVKLTPIQGDGGYDFVVETDDDLGKHRILVEIKRHAVDRPVGVEIIRQLYGVIDMENATAGIVFSTSGFTSGANEFAQLAPHRISLRSFGDVLAMTNDVYASARASGTVI
jgi:Restriction endonuclease